MTAKRRSSVAGDTQALAALQRETHTLPIVFAQVGDPIGGGFVASLARPGGNITGFALWEFAFPIKWLELLKQIVPGVTRVAVIYDPRNSASAASVSTIEAGAPSFGVQLSSAAVRDAAEIERAFNEFAAEPNDGVIVLPGAVSVDHRELITALAARYRLPAVYAFRYHVIGGGLASYGVDNIDLYRQAASYVSRILKGEKPADLPVQYATKFQLVINLKTAKALGLTVPLSLLVRADEVIE